MEGGEESGADRIVDSKDLQQQSKALDKLTDRVEDRQLDSTRVQEVPFLIRFTPISNPLISIRVFFLWHFCGHVDLMRISTRNSVFLWLFGLIVWKQVEFV